MIKEIVIAAAFVAASCSATFAKEVKCKVVLENTLVHKGKCDFSFSGSDGGFMLNFGKGNKWSLALAPQAKGEASVVSNVIIENGKASHYDLGKRFKAIEEHGAGSLLTWAGETFYRSNADRACWKSATGEVCAW